MENYAYSYPDSGGSSPRSREIDFENPTPSWEEQPLPGNLKVKFLVSYGGKIHPRSHDNQLGYVGGETKILAVDRNIKFSQFLSKLSVICESPPDTISFKYQLPGEELDALISVTNDDDLEHMMHEYDRLYRGSAKPARLRLFIFTSQRSGFGSGTSETRSERERYVHEAINSAPVVLDSSAVAPPVAHPQPAVGGTSNVDFLFGLEKGVGAGAGAVPPQQPPQVVKVHDPVPDPEIRVLDERFARSDPQIDARIQEMNRLQIAEQQRQQQMYRQRSDDNFVGGYSGDGYVQKLPEKLPPATIPASVPSSVPPQATYWQPEKNTSAGGGFPATMGHEQHHQPHQQQHHQPHQQQQQVYMIPAPAGMYHAPIVRPVNGQPGPGYYQVAQPQRIPSDVYREQQQHQQVYNMVPPPMSSPPPPTVPVSLPPKMAAPYQAEGMPVRQPAAAVTSLGVTDGGYQVAYDSATGRQMYHYTAAAPGGGVVNPPYPGVPAPAAVNTDARAAGPGGLTAEGKTVQKVLPTSAPV